MALEPPLFVDTNGVFGADAVGRIFGDIMGEGVVELGDLKVTAATGMFVDVAAGSCWVKGDTVPSAQPTYRCRSTAVENRGIAGSHATLARKDLVYLLLTDEAFAGTGKKFEILVLTGTAAASPVRPTLPSSAIALAEANVPAASSSVSNANIVDLRDFALANGGRLIVPAARVWRAAALSHTANGAMQSIAWDTVEYDDGDIVDLPGSATRLTIRQPGRYRYSTHIQFGGNGTGTRALAVRKNNTEIGYYDTPASVAAGAITVTDTVTAVKGDYFEVFAFQSSGGNLAYTPATQYMNFSMEWIRP